MHGIDIDSWPNNLHHNLQKETQYHTKEKARIILLSLGETLVDKFSKLPGIQASNNTRTVSDRHLWLHTLYVGLHPCSLHGSEALPFTSPLPSIWTSLHEMEHIIHPNIIPCRCTHPRHTPLVNCRISWGHIRPPKFIYLFSFEPHALGKQIRHSQ